MRLEKWFLSVTVAGCCATIPELARAELITEWEYTIEAAWSAWDPGTVQFIEGNEDVLRWGSEEEGFIDWRVTRNTDGRLFANSGIPGEGITLTFSDFKFDEDEARKFRDLIILPVLPIVGPIPFTQTLSFGLLQTPDDGPCPSFSTGSCDDIIIIENPEDLSAQFQIEDYLYRVSFVIDENNLENVQVFFNDLNGDGVEDLYLLTEENSTAVLPFSFLITAQQIPEPASAALIGLGALSIAVFRRRNMR